MRDDRSSVAAADGANVGDCEALTFELGCVERPVLGTVHKSGDLLVEIVRQFACRVCQDRNQQARLGVDGDSDVANGLVKKALAVEVGIELRMGLQRWQDGLDQQGVEGEASALPSG